METHQEKKIFLIGHSAGAHIVSLIALDKRYLSNLEVDHSVLTGWIGLSGPYTFNPLAVNYIRPIFESVKDDINQARPISFVSENTLPGLIVHGQHDKLVSIKNSQALFAALKKINSPIHLLEVDAGHFDTVLGLGVPHIGNKKVENAVLEFIGSL